MDQRDLAFVCFENANCLFRASLTVEGFVASDGDPEILLKRVSVVYENSIHKMSRIVNEIKTARENKQTISARKIWELGDEIFRLTQKLTAFSVQIDGLYGHLVRDLAVKRKWLEKVVIFRRYLPDKRFIPKSLNWAQCAKGTRKAAERLQSEAKDKANERERNY